VGAFTLGHLQGFALGKLELSKTVYACFRFEFCKD
jgi:hypothetical protein